VRLLLTRWVKKESARIRVSYSLGPAFDNPNATAIPKTFAEFSLGVGTSIEWSYSSAPQKYSANRTLSYWAGKVLGCTTTINGMTYVRAEKAQIDAWEELGNEG
jgi:choline dehydrogenase-like flavoprotein